VDARGRQGAGRGGTRRPGDCGRRRDRRGVPGRPGLPLPNGTQTDVFDERDGRPAIYVGVNLEDPWRIGELRAGYFDNLADLGKKGTWETRYGVAGLGAGPGPGLEVLFQCLIGHVATRAEAYGSTVGALAVI
jgi:hypothetical protein